MRPRRVTRLATAGLGLLLLGYAAGRLHQRDTVAAYRDLARTLEQMVEKYETANVVMWNALGTLAQTTDETDR